MHKATRSLPSTIRQSQQHYSSQARTNIQAVPTLRGPIDSIDIEEFRQRAFLAEEPILIKRKNDTNTRSPDIFTTALPATVKWFEGPESHGADHDRTLSYQYLSRFGTTILPYEFIVHATKASTNTLDDGVTCQSPVGKTMEVSNFLEQLSRDSPDGAFHRFHAPLSFFLEASKLRSAPRLYIAQAQIADLPKELQEDLPNPRLIKEAGKGDVYDSNIWIGLPPTYTPLHKDPNPNLFVQLASSKVVRIFKPNIGAAIYREVQQKIGQSSTASFRGEEMMEGPERDALEKSVWSHDVQAEGYEVVVDPGDALFIPKGWWHSIRSIGMGVTASVNWWFR